MLCLTKRQHQPGGGLRCQDEGHGGAGGPRDVAVRRSSQDGHVGNHRAQDSLRGHQGPGVRWCGHDPGAGRALWHRRLISDSVGHPHRNRHKDELGVQEGDEELLPGHVHHPPTR